MIAKELSTQVVCEEKWEVSVGKKAFILNARQIELLKEATKAGRRGMVWFDGLAISIPHIQYVTMQKRRYLRIDGNARMEISKSEYEAESKSLTKSYGLQHQTTS